MPTLAELQTRLITLNNDRKAAETRAIAAQSEAAKAAEAARVAQANAIAVGNEAATIRKSLESM